MGWSCGGCSMQSHFSKPNSKVRAWTCTDWQPFSLTPLVFGSPSGLCSGTVLNGALARDTCSGTARMCFSWSALKMIVVCPQTLMSSAARFATHDLLLIHSSPGLASFTARNMQMTVSPSPTSSSTGSLYSQVSGNQTHCGYTVVFLVVGAHVRFACARANIAFSAPGRFGDMGKLVLFDFVFSWSFYAHGCVGSEPKVKFAVASFKITLNIWRSFSGICFLHSPTHPVRPPVAARQWLLQMLPCLGLTGGWCIKGPAGRTQTRQRCFSCWSHGLFEMGSSLR